MHVSEFSELSASVVVAAPVASARINVSVNGRRIAAAVKLRARITRVARISIRVASVRIAFPGARVGFRAVNGFLRIDVLVIRSHGGLLTLVCVSIRTVNGSRINAFILSGVIIPDLSVCGTAHISLRVVIPVIHGVASVSHRILICAPVEVRVVVSPCPVYRRPRLSCPDIPGVLRAYISVNGLLPVVTVNRVRIGPVTVASYNPVFPGVSVTPRRHTRARPFAGLNPVIDFEV